MIYLYIPQPKLRAVIRATSDQVDIVGAPRQVGHAISVTLQGLHQFQLVALLLANNN